jgi:hypothetical protein
MNPWLAAAIIIFGPVIAWLCVGLLVWFWHVNHAQTGGVYNLKKELEYPVLQSPWEYIAHWPTDQHERWLLYSKACNLCLWLGAWLLVLRVLDVTTKGIFRVWKVVLHLLYGRYERVEIITRKLKGGPT